jgi:hypothetical protein
MKKVGPWSSIVIFGLQDAMQHFEMHWNMKDDVIGDLDEILRIRIRVIIHNVDNISEIGDVQFKLQWGGGIPV